MALRGNCRAPLVGTRTYGKAAVQGVFGLPNKARVTVMGATLRENTVLADTCGFVNCSSTIFASMFRLALRYRTNQHLIFFNTIRVFMVTGNEHDQAKSNM